MMDYTLVLGVDPKHLYQLSFVWPTWIRFKPSLLKHPVIVFADELRPESVRKQMTHPDLKVIEWPPKHVVYEGDESVKWYNPQRYKMLAGFVHVPAMHVHTTYWLKLDTDTVATGVDSWIDRRWFDGSPAIISQGWHYTKPPDQMQRLDAWAARHNLFPYTEPLGLIPRPNEDKVRHKRIISWCALFNTRSTQMAAQDANLTCGDFRLPVPSQDGYLWYHATRSGRDVKRVDMKARGWKHCSNTRSIMDAIKGSNREDSEQDTPSQR